MTLRSCKDGTCVGNSVGDGCAQCSKGHFQAGAQCLSCPEGVETTTIVLGAAAIVVVLGLLWRITRVRTDGRAAVEEIQGNSDTARSAAQGLSNTAIFISIAFSHLNLSFMCFELPFGYPQLLTTLARWVVSVFSFDFAMLTAPECQLQDEDPISVMTIKFAMTHVLFAAMVTLLMLAKCHCGEHNRFHSTNAAVALYTLSIGALTKSCVSAFTCATYFTMGRSSIPICTIYDIYMTLYMLDRFEPLIARSWKLLESTRSTRRPQLCAMTSERLPVRLTYSWPLAEQLGGCFTVSSCRFGFSRT